MAQQVDLAYEPVYLQGTAAPGYDALDLRRSRTGAFQEGVFGASTAFKVSQDTGANRFASIAQGEGEIQGDSVGGQGRYYCRQDGALAGVDVTPADATLPRVDQFVLEVKDDAHDGSGLNKARIRVLTGTPTSGADLNNRNGAAALPSTCMRLADALMPAGAAALTNANIRDRRPWARGAYAYRRRTTGDLTGLTATSFADIHSTDFTMRVELSGGPFRVSFVPSYWLMNPGGASMEVAAYIQDGVSGNTTSDGTAKWVPSAWQYWPSAGQTEPVNLLGERETITPGSKLIKPQYRAGGGATVSTCSAQAAYPAVFTVAEVPAGLSADNS